MIKVTTSGSFDKTEASLRRMASNQIYSSLTRLAEEGRAALEAATPAESGETARSWKANVAKRGSKWEVTWSNTNRPDGVPLAIMLQYGHATGTGGFVQGVDYINPALKPIFDKIADSVWKEVTRA